MVWHVESSETVRWIGKCVEDGVRDEEIGPMETPG